MNSRNKKIEICSYTVQSALNAQIGGADRVELCANPHEGGTTPSSASIILAREKLQIDLYVLIRPRGGDFYYSDLEFETMLKDIEYVKSIGANGVVAGILEPNGFIDVDRIKILIDTARPLKFTFHRAFDMSKDPYESLRALIELGADRILTSGLKQTAFEGRELISGLIKYADGKLIIMPGSGISPENIIQIMDSTGADEFHLSAKSVIKSRMKFFNGNISMGNNIFSEYDTVESDVDKISKTVKLLKNLR